MNSFAVHTATHLRKSVADSKIGCCVVPDSEPARSRDSRFENSEPVAGGNWERQR